MALNDRPLVPLLGVSAVLISVAGILGALFLAPWFAVHENALSDLGRSGRASAPVFNGALIASGAFGLGFVGGLWRQSTTTISRVGIVPFGVAAGFVVLVGAFSSPKPYHYPVAVGFYVVLTFALFVHGTGTALAGKTRVGLATIWLGVVHTASWIAWWVLMDDQGIAGPEAIGAGVFSAWVCVMVWWSS